ncbi:hypothetical protein R3P38DRAFT_2891182 [Favolaschia claudopus]|uniref:Uncharacterized protein n=1 Tax=Favolaschia claudopus TaxID=2862362 RepID=A0AAW0CV59_9AGAR
MSIPPIRLPKPRHPTGATDTPEAVAITRKRNRHTDAGEFDSSGQCPPAKKNFDWAHPKNFSDITTSQNGIAEAVNRLASLATHIANDVNTTASISRGYILQQEEIVQNRSKEVADLQNKVAFLTADVKSLQESNEETTSFVLDLQYKLLHKEAEWKVAQDNADKLGAELNEKHALVENLRAQLAEETANATAAKAEALSNEKRLMDQVQEISVHSVNLQALVSSVLSKRMV